jgi:hypothetical protein
MISARNVLLAAIVSVSVMSLAGAAAAADRCVELAPLTVAAKAIALV